MPGGFGNTLDMNETGWICGESSSIDGTIHAVAWDPEYHIYEIKNLPGNTNSRATAISDSGLVVGDSTSSVDYTSDMFT